MANGLRVLAVEALAVTVQGELIGDYGRDPVRHTRSRGFRSDGWMWTQLNGDPCVTDPIGEGGPRWVPTRVSGSEWQRKSRKLSIPPGVTDLEVG